MSSNLHIRIRLAVRGRVQGVGFRPAVFRLATALDLTGVVGNDSQGAFIEVQGAPAAIACFVRRLPGELPARALVSDLQQQPLALVPEESAFRIQISRDGGEQDAEIAPDIATCADCRRELFDPNDRRYRYPFINCTNCGPRYSIVTGVPYDRERTSMRRFPMCADCRMEYEDPQNRRFHAQPNACPVCGPQIWFVDADGQRLDGDAIQHTLRQLRAGRIIGIKGLGGFHLACDAANDAAVRRLRDRKHREARPLALMVADLAAAERLVRLDTTGRDLLQSWRAPIVLAPACTNAPVSKWVAPGSLNLGLLLPYTPLHHLLFEDGQGPLVMTSANPVDEPLCAANEEALERLRGIADGLLMHDRDIVRRVDDSVLAVGLATADHLLPVRRSRGYVPEPIRLAAAAPIPLLALGGDLKSALCMVKDRNAVMSEHLGELENPAAYRNFVRAVDCFREILGVDPKQLVCDLHPRYHSTRYARSLGLPVMAVQHHFAHAVAALVEHELAGPVLALCADGTGYGADGSIWGCELMVVNPCEFRRVGYLRPFPMIGGDAAARDTWRPAAALLADSLTASEFNALDPGADVPDDAWRLLLQQLAQGAPRAPRTSSLGRLFDAVAWILGLCSQNRFEADAAMTLEAAAAECSSEVEPLPFPFNRDGGVRQLDYRPLVQEILRRRQHGVGQATLAKAFHQALADVLSQVIAELCEQENVSRVVLSGGCFLNRRLTDALQGRLAGAGLEAYSHRRVPTGDGGLALGQAWIAVSRLLRDDENLA